MRIDFTFVRKRHVMYIWFIFNKVIRVRFIHVHCTIKMYTGVPVEGGLGEVLGLLSSALFLTRL